MYILCYCLLSDRRTERQKLLLGQQHRTFNLRKSFFCFGDWSLLIAQFFEWNASVFWLSQRLSRLCYWIQLDFACDDSGSEKLRSFVQFSSFLLAWMASFRWRTVCILFPTWCSAWSLEHELLKRDLLVRLWVNWGSFQSLIKFFLQLNMFYPEPDVLLETVLYLQSVSLPFIHVKRWL